MLAPKIKKPCRENIILLHQVSAMREVLNGACMGLKVLAFTKDHYTKDELMSVDNRINEMCSFLYILQDELGELEKHIIASLMNMDSGE
jgi:hypothetical protein